MPDSPVPDSPVPDSPVPDSPVPEPSASAPPVAEPPAAGEPVYAPPPAGEGAPPAPGPEAADLPLAAEPPLTPQPAAVEPAAVEPAATSPAEQPSADQPSGRSALVKVSVTDVRTAVPATPGVEAGLVVLTEDLYPNRSVDIVIGQPEARAVQVAWLGGARRRPSTWDLWTATVEALGGQLERVVVTAVEEGVHFYADIELLSHGEQRIVLSARPSDAVALALRTPGAEIFIREQVLVDLGLPSEPEMDN